MKEPKYKAEICQLLKETLGDLTWTGIANADEAIEFFLKQQGTSYQIMSDELQTGLDNGHSIDVQFQLIKKAIALL